MCINASKCSPLISSFSPVHRRRIKRSKVRVRITPSRSASEATTGRGSEMALQNLKLYLENRCIIEENEKLRKKALLLDEENKALLSEMKKKFSHLDEITTVTSNNH
ncbi:protein LITTLE ZIPPER 1-like [Magnolia sinica]|uniref:protein LITTLE ZIPPER 1-like n=1 Tax=Magnolia sinica TaxID=86752 RepID=UPI0026586773|nr:protein LITTLE ZIPPER 1-like [Magnolia sinica]